MAGRPPVWAARREEILRLIAGGANQVRLAKWYGVSAGAVHMAIARLGIDYWKWRRAYKVLRRERAICERHRVVRFKSDWIEMPSA